MKPSKRCRFLHEFLVRLQNFPSHEIGHVQLFCFWYDCWIPLIDMLVQSSANVSEKCVWTLDPQIMPPPKNKHFIISLFPKELVSNPEKKRHGKTWIPHFSTIEVDNYIPSISERSEVSWEQLAVNVWKMDLGWNWLHLERMCIIVNVYIYI